MWGGPRHRESGGHGASVEGRMKCRTRRMRRNEEDEAERGGRAGRTGGRGLRPGGGRPDRWRGRRQWLWSRCPSQEGAWRRESERGERALCCGGGREAGWALGAGTICQQRGRTLGLCRGGCSREAPSGRAPPSISLPLPSDRNAPEGGPSRGCTTTTRVERLAVLLLSELVGWSSQQITEQAWPSARLTPRRPARAPPPRPAARQGPRRLARAPPPA
jgi:hypothetical protein